MCVTTDKGNCDHGQSISSATSHQLSRSHTVVKQKKVKKKNFYKISPQDPTQTSMGEKEEKGRKAHNSSHLCGQFHVVLKDRI